MSSNTDFDFDFLWNLLHKESQFEEAHFRSEDAAQNGNAGAQHVLGKYFERKGEAGSSFNWYEKSFENAMKSPEDGICQFVIARSYSFGIGGVQKDSTKALEWYTKSANQEIAAAQFNLGVHFYNTKDWDQAVTLYSKAAKHEFAYAQNVLSMCYFEGIGLPKNPGIAFEWALKAAEQGIPIAQYNVAVSYELGNGVEPDCEKAVEWFTKSAQQGFVDAQFTLGYNYEKGKLVQKDMQKAMYWFTEAANKGDKSAQTKLGVIYKSGKNGIPKNLEKAVDWLITAKESGGIQAKKLLEKHDLNQVVLYKLYPSSYLKLHKNCQKVILEICCCFWASTLHGNSFCLPSEIHVEVSKIMILVWSTAESHEIYYKEKFI